MRFGALAAAAILAASPLTAAINGAWTAERTSDRVHMSMRLGQTSNIGHTLDLPDLTGLTVAQTSAETATPVRFMMQRDAGTVHFEGSFRSGIGNGHFTFEPDEEFLERVRALGVEIDDDGDWSEEKELFALAALDVSEKYIGDLAALGFEELELDEVVGARIHGVSGARVREYRRAGFDVDLEDAMALSIHRVTPELIRELRDAGLRIDDADDAVALKIHRVTPAFIAEMLTLGYGGLDSDDFAAMSIHGVTSGFVRELRSLGYETLDSDDLVAMRIHGVTGEFIRDANAEYQSRLSVDDLVRLRIIGRTSRRGRH